MGASTRIPCSSSSSKEQQQEQPQQQELEALKGGVSERTTIMKMLVISLSDHLHLTFLRWINKISSNS